MFLTSGDNVKLFENFEKIGLRDAVRNNSVLIKINLSRVYEKNHPRTDMTLLKTLVEYVYQNGGNCAVAEAANGYLRENLIASGFAEMLKRFKIKIIDVDAEDCNEAIALGERHHIPKIFRDYPVRLAVPAASKREGMVYSNNVKLFFGAVPRKFYQLDGADARIGAPRPRLHLNLHTSVASLFLALNDYSPFHFYLNGGLAYNENTGEFILCETYVGDNAPELDNYLFENFFADCEYPEYLNILKSNHK